MTRQYSPWDIDDIELAEYICFLLSCIEKMADGKTCSYEALLCLDENLFPDHHVMHIVKDFFAMR